MSSTNKYNTTYSATDIEKYLKGELSPREMHDLENAALEDPFLADALDGMSVLLSPPPVNDGTPPADDLSRDLDELHTRLNTRAVAVSRPNNTRRSIPRWSIAATIILLLGIGCLTYFTFLTSGRSKLVTPSSPTAAAPPVVAASPPPAESTAPPKQAAPPAPVTLAEPPLLARSKTPAQVSEGIEDRKVSADTLAGTSATADMASKPSAAPSGQLEGRVGGLTLDSTARISMANALYKRAANSLVFKGRVLDNHDNPVPGASLILNGYANTGTVTDRQGQFKLYLPSKDSIPYVTVAMIGYGQRSFPLNTLTGNDMADHVIHLQPSEASLDEVVVSGFGSKRKETMAAVPSDSEDKLDSLWQKARPVIGKAAYLHYLDTAQKSLALDSSITGTETVSFEVDKKGILTSFKIEQSLSPAHDEAIIRLVKEGPAWQLLKQKEVRATVSLHF
jgi:hypothetical protein